MGGTVNWVPKGDLHSATAGGSAGDFPLKKGLKGLTLMNCDGSGRHRLGNRDKRGYE